jgi:5-formaminoimidazole-4-carboxamide-1-beta-D-ribofuranosyl 5'-monophosphate synthetase
VEIPTFGNQPFLEIETKKKALRELLNNYWLKKLKKNI